MPGWTSSPKSSLKANSLKERPWCFQRQWPYSKRFQGPLVGARSGSGRYPTEALLPTVPHVHFPPGSEWNWDSCMLHCLCVPKNQTEPGKMVFVLRLKIVQEQPFHILQPNAKVRGSSWNLSLTFDHHEGIFWVPFEGCVGTVSCLLDWAPSSELEDPCH